MKFSKQKKAKIRKNKQRRINRTCKYMIGCRVDFKHGYTVKDQAKIDNIMYLLVQVENGQYAIYKIVKVGEYVRLSNKKVLRNQKAFSNHEYWYNHSTITITDEGKIKSVQQTEQHLIFTGDKPIYIYIVEV